MIIIAVIFLLLIFILIMVYKYDVYRYLYLNTDLSDNSCISNYMSIKRVEYPSKVVVALTSSPGRIKNIKPMVKSILTQTVRVDHIALNIPKEHKSKTPYSIPDNLDKMLNVFQCGRDYGNGTKCIPTILREKDSDTLIILLDDSYLYPSDFIEKVVASLQDDSYVFGKGVIATKASSFKEDIVNITKQHVSDSFILKYIDGKRINFKHNLLYPIRFTS